MNVDNSKTNSYYEASISDVCGAKKLWHGARSSSRMWGIKILESLRILIKILSLVHYHGGLISDDYVIKIIINVLLGTSLGSGLDGDCEFWTIKTLIGDPGHRRGNSDLGLVQIVKPSQSLRSHTLTFNYFGKNRRKCPWFTPSLGPGPEPTSAGASTLNTPQLPGVVTRDTCPGENCAACHAWRDRVAWQSDPLSWHAPTLETPLRTEEQWNGSRYLQHRNNRYFTKS